MADRPPISVILATTDPWPDLANCLDVLEPQVGALNGELIVGDAHGEALDGARVARSRCLSWIRLPGASVFELSARAAERARGEVIAATEDHCVVAPHWCAEILRGRQGPLALHLGADHGHLGGDISRGCAHRDRRPQRPAGPMTTAVP